MERVLSPIEERNLREKYQTQSTRELVGEANSEYQELQSALTVLKIERANNYQSGIFYALEQFCRHEEKLYLMGEELRMRADFDHKMLDF